MRPRSKPGQTQRWRQHQQCCAERVRGGAPLGSSTTPLRLRFGDYHECRKNAMPMPEMVPGRLPQADQLSIGSVP